MKALSRRLFGALALATAVILLTASSTPPAPFKVITASAASTWLTRLNAWRATTAVPSLTENTTWSAGDVAHAKYMVKNDLITHYETPGVPYYTAAGDIAAQNSNLNVSSYPTETDDHAIDWWMQAPIHAMGLMDPRLVTTGFGSYRESGTGWNFAAAVDTGRGATGTGAYPVYYPGNGSTEPLTSYDGYEYPNPLAA